MFTYRPRAFREDDRDRLLALAAEVGFGVLVGDGPTYCPVPFEVDEDRVRFHLARANPSSEALDGATVDLLVVGPHGYVSPTWYTTSDQVPTWNYAVLAIRGAVRALPDEALPELLARQVARYERAWTPAEVPNRAMSSMLRAIRGFELAVDRIEGKTKLSQNRDRADHEAVAARLEGQVGALTAEALRRR